MEQPQSINPADAAKKPDDPSPPTMEQMRAGVAAAVHEKRSKTTKNGEPKAKKAKASAAALEKAKEEEIPQPAPSHSKPANESDVDSPVATV